MDIKDIVINQDTKMTQLFDAYKGLKDKMEEVHPNFKMLKTPLAKVLLANATIKEFLWITVNFSDKWALFLDKP